MATNQILQALNDEDAGWLRPRLKPVELKARDQIELPNQLIECVFFIETGIAAVLAVNGKIRIGVGLVGCEGASGVPLLLGHAYSLHSTVMLIDGTARSITSNALHEAIDHSKAAVITLCLGLSSTVAHTALSNAKSSIQHRVARWVLMTHDRVAKDEVPLTHEVIADTLGVRRASVSVALKELQEAGFIDTGHVLDRRGIRNFVGRLYGVPEKEFDRLIVGSVRGRRTNQTDR